MKTREVQLFMQYRARSTEEGLKTFQDVIRRQDWKTWDEYMEKYSVAVNPDAAAKVLYLTDRFQTIGFLVTEGLVDLKLLYRFNSNTIIMAWERLEPYVMGVRKYVDNPKYCDSFEWLYNQFKKIQEE